MVCRTLNHCFSALLLPFSVHFTAQPLACSCHRAFLPGFSVYSTFPRPPSGLLKRPFLITLVKTAPAPTFYCPLLIFSIAFTEYIDYVEAGVSLIREKENFCVPTRSVKFRSSEVLQTSDCKVRDPQLAKIYMNIQKYTIMKSESHPVPCILFDYL